MVGLILFLLMHAPLLKSTTVLSISRSIGQSVAAVQLRGLPLMAHKQMFVWLPKNESKELQFVIAAVATALMAVSNEMMAAGN